MRVNFDDIDNNRHVIADGQAHRQSVSGLRVVATRDVQISKPLRAKFQRVLDRVTVGTQLSFTVTYYFVKPELLGNPSEADIERAFLFVFNLVDLFAAQSEGVMTFVIESDGRETVRQYCGLMTMIDPQQIGASVRVTYRFAGAEFRDPE